MPNEKSFLDHSFANIGDDSQSMYVVTETTLIDFQYKTPMTTYTICECRCDCVQLLWVLYNRALSLAHARIHWHDLAVPPGTALPDSIRIKQTIIHILLCINTYCRIQMSIPIPFRP